MERLTVFQGYNEYRDTVNKALTAAVEDFVYIGYLLKKAKDDPVILSGSPYENYKDFAREEFKLDESQVSRLININEKYADGTELLPEYKGFGYSKLGEMLSLPKEITDQLTPETTREEIRGIKEDIREGEKTTPIERYAERAQLTQADGNELFRFFQDYFRTHESEFIELKEWAEAPTNAEPASDVLFPNGEGIIRAVVKGEGPCMIKSRGVDEPPTLTYFSDGNRRESVSWEEIMDAVYEVGCEQGFTKEGWEKLYKASQASASESDKPAEENTDNPSLPEADSTEEKNQPSVSKPEDTEPLKGTVEDAKYDEAAVARIEARITHIGILISNIKRGRNGWKDIITEAEAIKRIAEEKI